MNLPPPARDWQERGAVEDLAGIDCFVVELGDRDSDRAVVWLHGFPSSSLDWRGVVDRVHTGTGRAARMLLPDLPGYGFSAKPAGYSYSLVDQADRVVVMLARRGIANIDLIAHDMGTSVACELLARREMNLLPFSIDSLVLTNGSVYIEQARLTPSQQILRSRLGRAYTKLASERLFRWQLRRILGRTVADEELAAMWALMNHNDGIARLPDIIGYIAERYRFHERWTAPLARLDVPTTIVWGKRDPVAVAAIGRRLAETIPGAKLEWLDDVGHFPMLEAPGEFIEKAGLSLLAG
ncbi:MAG: alpha/beta hydrolase [Wenzhouxiangellaceae bacterium]|nr:alpha/beta hydrolase [Wenzhouxiangellaceae bacterium]